MKIVLTHQNADFDAVASMLGVWMLDKQVVPILPSRQLQSVEEFLSLYRNGLPFIDWHDFKPIEPVTQIILTDTHSRQQLVGVPRDIPTQIIEHHALNRKLQSYEEWAGEIVGATTTLLVERLQKRGIKPDSLEATLLALGIYADTGMMTYGGTTSRDVRAAAWLLEHGAVLDTIQRFLASPLNAEQQALFEALFENAEHRTIQGYDITLCKTATAKHVSGINSVAASLRDVLNADAMFILVAMPNHMQLVCRSKADAIHVGELAKELGGGGHPRAAAATIYRGDLTSVSARIWDYLQISIQPAVRISDLMSYGVQTVEADERIEDMIARLRRIGHEGYPVLDSDRVVGLLTLRDADRALEHGLNDATVRDVMLGGTVTLTPDDPVSLLEETMVKSDWGQIPIVNGYGALLGIVTRTDLIKHWVQTHPAKVPDIPTINLSTVKRVLGLPNVKLLETIANLAQQNEIPMYMVGGVVRDLLLERPNYDIDFVLEGNAIDFATRLSEIYGGRIHSYRPFGTAKWHLDEQVAANLSVDLAVLPDHIDFATARSELYEHPTALPTVYNSGIKLDLRRRDFTINTIAVQLSPMGTAWRILDFYGGIPDLEQKTIRVLHSLSFVDDPTRILRAVRFSQRLFFTIEPRTLELVQSALSMLRRITGERIRNEITLMLAEVNPAYGLLELARLDMLTSIHTGFILQPEVKAAFQALKRGLPDWATESKALRWHLVMAHIPAANVVAVARRLLFSQNHAEDMQRTAELVQNPTILTNPTTLASELDAYLQPFSETSLAAVWLILDTAERERLEHYYHVLRHIKPTINGNHLKQRGLQQGPEYRIILARLREAWLDGHVRNVTEEKVYLEQLIHEVYSA